MLYLNDGHIRQLGWDWERLADRVEDAVRAMDAGDSAAPLKGYLRFPGTPNRIIATPAYLGGSTELAGIKWIAGFPGNPQRGLPRARNLIALNDPSTGEPLAVLRSDLLNGLRAAAVSGAMLRRYAKLRPAGGKGFTLGVIGWGPIGRLHLDMAAALLGPRLERVLLHDVRGIAEDSIPPEMIGRVEATTDWRELYRQSDVTATCTVAPSRYIDEPPPQGALLLHVSLRDYEPHSVAGLRTFVDDWSQVCREDTDIERLHAAGLLAEPDALTLADAVCRDALARLAGETIFFNPMGLGIFDLALAGDFYRRALTEGLGVGLE
ncbi:2,3-diaminopropionate biosynthesis protein SbnB [Paenibacillus albicereus]|uniref:2,3-diaminopropionate biosynthesis protein SbnB n=1 Tax=Paenibacillus albicereus TaxID=2726185 RepID=A0A6H2H0J5_9BACL|nr:2,3-diaminopropionate biosynthesis protein SbnB [Paenibacillus albicereus]QJC53172.1 2,3-diaminopropionate biosynthesis protein SbnB [Paenibacillus albicereus]